MNTSGSTTSSLLSTLTGVNDWAGAESFLNNPDISNADKISALHYEQDDWDLDKMSPFEAVLLKNGPFTLVQLMVAIGGLDLVKGRKIDIGQDAFSFQPLQLACRLGSYDVVKLLCDVGGKELVVETKQDGFSSLMAACWDTIPCIELIKLLVHVGGKAIVTKQVIRVACSNELMTVDVLEYLLEVGGSAIFKGENLNYLHKVCQESEEPATVDLLKSLLSHGARDLLDEKDRYGCLPIQVLISPRGSRYEPPNLEKFKILLEEGIRNKVGGENGVGGLFDQFTYELGDMDGGYTEVSTTTLEGLFGTANEEGKFRYSWDAVAAAIGHIIAGAPILQGAIGNVSSDILSDLIAHFDCLSIRDGKGRLPIQAAVEDGLRWDDGMNVIVEATATDENCLPIHVAAKYGLKWEDGMKCIIEANQAAMIEKDPMTGLYPFALAAVGEDSDLSSIYELLMRRLDVSTIL